MDKNKYIALSVFLVVVSFYGGIKFNQYQRVFSLRNSNRGGQLMMNRGNFNGDQNQRMGGRGNMGGMINGDILSRDDKSITVSMGNLGSKIIFFSEKTQFSKLASSSKEELLIGAKVFGQGTPNPDGSLNAENIQIR